VVIAEVTDPKTILARVSGKQQFKANVWKEASNLNKWLSEADQK
jgi:hypothetical protein